MSRITKKSDTSLDIIKDFYIKGPIETDVLNDKTNTIQQCNINIGILDQIYKKSQNITDKLQETIRKNKQELISYKKEEDDKIYSKDDLLSELNIMKKEYKMIMTTKSLITNEKLFSVENHIQKLNTVFLPYFDRNIERLKTRQTQPQPSKNDEFLRNIQTYQNQKVIHPVAKSVGNFAKKMLTIAVGPIVNYGRYFVIQGVITNVFVPLAMAGTGIDSSYKDITRTLVGMTVVLTIGMSKEYERKNNDPNALQSEMNFMSRLRSGICYMVVNSVYILPEGYLPDLGITTTVQNLIGDGMLYSYSSNIARTVFPVAVKSIFTIFHPSANQINVIDTAFNTPVNPETYVNFSEIFYKIKEDSMNDSSSNAFYYCMKYLWNIKEQSDNTLLIIGEFPGECFRKFLDAEIYFVKSFSKTLQPIVQYTYKTIKRVCNLALNINPVTRILNSSISFVFNIVSTVLLGPMIKVGKLLGPTAAIAAGIMWSGFVISFLDATLLHNEAGELFYALLTSCVDGIITLFINPKFYETMISQSFVIPIINPALTNLIQSQLDIFTSFLVISYLAKNSSLNGIIKNLPIVSQFGVVSMSLFGLGFLKSVKIVTLWKEIGKGKQYKYKGREDWIRKSNKEIVDFSDKLYYCFWENPSYTFFTEIKNSIQESYLDFCKSCGLYQFLHDIELRNGEYTLLHQNIDSLTNFFLVDNLARIKVSKITNEINNFAFNSILNMKEDYWEPSKIITRTEYENNIKRIADLKTNVYSTNVNELKALDIQEQYLRKAYDRSKDIIGEEPESIELPRKPKMGSPTVFAASVFLDVQYWWRNPENSIEIQKAFNRIFQDELYKNKNAGILNSIVEDAQLKINTLNSYIDELSANLKKYENNSQIIFIKEQINELDKKINELETTIQSAKSNYSGLSVDYAIHAMRDYIQNDSLPSNVINRMVKNIEVGYKQYDMINFSESVASRYRIVRNQIESKLYETQIQHNDQKIVRMKQEGIYALEEQPTEFTIQKSPKIITGVTDVSIGIVEYGEKSFSQLLRENLELKKRKLTLDLETYKNKPEDLLKLLMTKVINIQSVKDFLPRVSNSIYDMLVSESAWNLSKPSIGGIGGLALSLTMNPLISMTSATMTTAGYFAGLYSGILTKTARTAGYFPLMIWWAPTPIPPFEPIKTTVTKTITDQPINLARFIINRLSSETQGLMLIKALTTEKLNRYQEKLNQSQEKLNQSQEKLNQSQETILREFISDIENIKEYTGVDNLPNLISQAMPIIYQEEGHTSKYIENTQIIQKTASIIRTELSTQVSTLTDNEIETMLEFSKMYAYGNPEISLPEITKPLFNLNKMATPAPDDNPELWLGIKKHTTSKVGVTLYNDSLSGRNDKLDSIVPKSVQEVWLKQIKILTNYNNLKDVKLDSSTKMLGENMLWLSYMTESSKELKKYSVNIDMLLTMLRKTQFTRTFDENKQEILKTEEDASKRWTSVCDNVSIFGNCNVPGYLYRQKQYPASSDLKKEIFGIGTGDSIRLSDEMLLKLANFERSTPFNTVDEFYTALKSKDAPEIKWNNPYLLDLFSLKRPGIDQTYYNKLVDHQIDQYTINDNQKIRDAKKKLTELRSEFGKIIEDKNTKESTNILKNILFENWQYIDRFDMQKNDITFDPYTSDYFYSDDRTKTNKGVALYANYHFAISTLASGGIALGGVPILTTTIASIPGAAAGLSAAEYVCEKLGVCPGKESPVGVVQDINPDPEAIFTDKVRKSRENFEALIESNSKMVINKLTDSLSPSEKSILKIQKSLDEQYRNLYSAILNRNKKNALFTKFRDRVIDESYLVNEKQLFTSIMGGSENFNSCIFWKNNDLIESKYREWIDENSFLNTCGTG